MSGTSRAFFGAVLGALLTLIAHPASRPFLLTPFQIWGSPDAVAQSQWLPGARYVLAQPEDVVLASLWMHSASESLLRRQEIGKDDLQKLLRVADEAGRADPDNAYWPQMAALFHRELGDEAAARRQWARASRKARWNDYQSKRLINVRTELSGETGGFQSWQLASVYQLRSAACARSLLSMSRAMLSKASQSPDGGLELRFTTLMNGKLIRDGGRSVAASALGLEMMEVAAYPAGQGPSGSQKRLLLARYGLVNALRDRGMVSESQEANLAYRGSDAWMAFAMREDRDQTLGLVTAGSLASATVPAVFLFVGIVGAAIWGTGLLLARYQRLQRAFAPPVAPMLGIVLALAVYFATGLGLASVTVVLCFAFLAFTPLRERKAVPTDLGPMFGFTLLLLAIALTVTLGGFLLGASTAGSLLLPALGVPEDYASGSTLFLGLAGIVLGLLLLTAPTWAMVQHIPTPSVVVLTFKRFGQMLCSTCLLLAVVATPIAMYSDRQFAETLQQMVENEPNYYLLKQ